MKRTICLISCLTMLLAAGCGSDVPGSRVAVQTTGVKDVLQSKMAEEDMRASSASEEVPSVSDEENAVSEPLRETSFGSDVADAEVDIDLTVDNADLIYAEVFAMMYTPEEYTGKTVKMKGQFVFYYDEEKDRYYYACLIKDAMACCAQGLEFIPAGDCIYPDDFPPAMTEIWVTGEFGVFEDGDLTYCALKDAVYYFNAQNPA